MKTVTRAICALCDQPIEPDFGVVLGDSIYKLVYKDEEATFGDALDKTAPDMACHLGCLLKLLRDAGVKAGMPLIMNTMLGPIKVAPSLFDQYFGNVATQTTRQPIADLDTLKEVVDALGNGEHPHPGNTIIKVVCEQLDANKNYTDIETMRPETLHDIYDTLSRAMAKAAAMNMSTVHIIGYAYNALMAERKSMAVRRSKR